MTVIRRRGGGVPAVSVKRLKNKLFKLYCAMSVHIVYIGLSGIKVNVKI